MEYGDLKMSKSSQWMKSIAYVAVFVVFFFYPSVNTNDHVPSFVGKRCQAQTLLSKQLSHLLSLSKHFSVKRKEKKEYTHPRDLWRIKTHNIATLSHSYSSSCSVDQIRWRRLLSISSINLLMHDPISISRHEKAKPRVLSSIYLASI